MERRATDASADALQHHGLLDPDQQPRLLAAIRAGVGVSGTHPHHPERIVQFLAIWTSEKHGATAQAGFNFSNAPTMPQTKIRCQNFFHKPGANPCRISGLNLR